MRHLIQSVTKTACGLEVSRTIEVTVFQSQCDCPTCNEIEEKFIEIDTATFIELQRLEKARIVRLGVHPAH